MEHQKYELEVLTFLTITPRCFYCNTTKLQEISENLYWILENNQLYIEDDRRYRHLKESNSIKHYPHLEINTISWRCLLLCAWTGPECRCGSIKPCTATVARRLSQLVQPWFGWISSGFFQAWNRLRLFGLIMNLITSHVDPRASLDQRTCKTCKTYQGEVRLRCIELKLARSKDKLFLSMILGLGLVRMPNGSHTALVYIWDLVIIEFFIPCPAYLFAIFIHFFYFSFPFPSFLNFSHTQLDNATLHFL